MDSPPPAAPGASQEEPSRPARWREVAWTFLKLGLTSFGGPIAHLGHFRAEIVEKRRWIAEAHYADLVALCQFLPGPASSQVAFALGRHRAGLAGAITASLCFTLPSAGLMIALAYGVGRAGDLQGAGWVHGLKIAAVAIVAQAVWGMGKKLCPDRARSALGLGTAAALTAFPGGASQLVAIATGALVGFALYRDAPVRAAEGDAPAGGSPWRGAAALVVFAALLAILPVLAAATRSPLASVIDSFYRSGSLVFGGGHVVLPLLRAEVVPGSLPGAGVTDDAFLAGYGAAQAIPGPLFTFAAYLGASMSLGLPPWASGLVALTAIFLPAWLLVGGALPFWHRIRSKTWAQAALAGANAAVVGVLLAALYTPVYTEGIRAPKDFAAALVAFGLLEAWRTPPWMVVGALAAAGQWVLS